MLEAADAAGDAGHPHRGAGRRRTGDPRERNGIRRPLDLCGLALIRLSLGTLRDPLQRSHRGAHLRKIFQKRIVVFNLPLDAVQHAARDLLIGADEQEELLVAVHKAPRARGFGKRSFPAPARERERKQFASQYRGLDLRDGPNVIVAPGERKRFRQVRLAKEPKVLAALIATSRIYDGRQIADLAGGF